MSDEQPLEPEVVESGGGSNAAISGGALEAISRAEIDVAIATAKRYPRDLNKFKLNAIAAATSTQEIAEGCSYYLERTDKDGTKKPIEGPSIRLAEICMSFFNNTRWGGRVIGEDEKYVYAQGVAHDVENNNFVAVEVARKITGRTGRRFTADMVGVTGAAAVSVSMRNATFRIIPRAYVEEIRLKAKKVAMGDASTVVQRWARAAKFFSLLGVTEKQLLEKLGREKIEDLAPEDIGRLNGLRTALQDGMTSVAEQFAAAAPAEEAAGLENAPEKPAAETTSDKVAEKMEKKKGRPAKEKPAPAEPTAADRGALLGKLRDMLSKTFETGPQIDDAIARASKNSFGSWQAFAAGASIQQIQDGIAGMTVLMTDEKKPTPPPAEKKPAADFHEWIAKATEIVSRPDPDDEERATYALRVLRGFEMLELPLDKAMTEAASATGGTVGNLEQLTTASMDDLKKIHRHLMAIG